MIVFLAKGLQINIYCTVRNSVFVRYSRKKLYLAVSQNEVNVILTFRHIQNTKSKLASTYNRSQISGNKTCRSHDVTAEKTDKSSLCKGFVIV